MKYLLKIVFILILVNPQIYAQKIYPDKSTSINREKVQRHQKIVNKIDSMQLRCDTILIKQDGEVSYEFEGIYFDKQNRLRKYLSRYIVNDGSHDDVTICTYYNENGNLIYILYNGSNHCEATDEYFYIYNECIIDFMCELDCDCCEDEMTQEEIDNIRPVIGNKLSEAREWMSNYIDINNLFKMLRKRRESE